MRGTPSAAPAAAPDRVEPARAATLAAVPGATPAGAPAVAPAGTPDPTGLLNLTPFETSDGIRYVDVVQPLAVNDFYTILKFYMPESLLPLTSENRPVFTGDLAYLGPIAAMEGVSPDGKTTVDPGPWYADLAVPFLVDALSHVGDDYSKLLNAKRARTQMSRAVAAAPVYNTQMPALYSYHFAEQVPAIAPYLRDQVTNSAAYAAQIQADAATWKQQVIASLVNPKPADVLAFTDIADKLSALGAAGHFWAYFLFKHATSATALDQLRQLGMTSGQVTMRFAVEVQRVCALLGVLDESGTFTAEYAKVIGLFQVTNTLPQLVDYAANEKAYADIVGRILEQFIHDHADSPDPEIRQAVQDLQDAMDAGWTIEFVNAFFGIAGTISGVYDWRNLNIVLQERGYRGTGNLPGFLADAVSAAMAAAGMALFIYSLDNWDDLDAIGQANVVASGVELFVNFTMFMIKQGTAISEIFKASGWAGLKIVLNPLASNVERALQDTTSGTMKWLLGETEADLRPGIPLASLDGALEETRELVDTRRLSALERALGSNIDEVALRVGAVFAVVNLILTALSLSEATDPLDIADNSLFLASAAIELIGYAVGWVAGVVTAAAITSTVAAVVSACSVVGAALALVGLIVLIVSLAIHYPSPVETFATGAAKDEGFFMALGYAIESLLPWAPANGPSLVGVTLGAVMGAAVVVRAGADGTVGFGPPDHTGATSLGLTVDGSGAATLSAVVSGPKGPAVLALTAGPAGALSFAAMAGDQTSAAATTVADAADAPPAVTAADQAWTATLLSAPTVADARRDDGTYPALAGAFSLESVAQPGLFLDLTGAAPRLTTAAPAVALTMVTQLPEGLTMPDLRLTTADRDRLAVPHLSSPGSIPRTWTLTPALPTFLSVDAGGVVRQVLGVAPPVTAAASYTLTCTNAAGTASTTFAISVITPPPPPPVPLVPSPPQSARPAEPTATTARP